MGVLINTLVFVMVGQFTLGMVAGALESLDNQGQLCYAKEESGILGIIIYPATLGTTAGCILVHDILRERKKK